MSLVDRISALCDQTRLTGIDFIQVVDPTVQTVLRVFFIVDPTTLDTALIDPLLLLDPVGMDVAGPPVAETTLSVTIISDETRQEVDVVALDWRKVRSPSGIRPILEVTVAEPGDFSIHRLKIDDPSGRIDPFFNNVAFSFKQGCPSVFDCLEDCDPQAGEDVDFPIDYLARDFHSFRQALLDFAAQRYLQWSEPLEADQAVMLMEIMAALGDEFAYTQDRYAREAALETASQRRSRSALARLVDYTPDPGRAAETELAVWVSSGLGGQMPEIGARIWALPEGRNPLPFSVLNPVWHHENWNEIPLHCPDSDVECLPKGATEAYLVTAAPTAAEMPPGWTLTPEQFWVGRRAILRSRPDDPGEPERAFAVTITAAEHLIDELVPGNGGPPTQITRIAWQEPIPWPLILAGTAALMNVVTVVAGEEITEYFRVGSTEEIVARHPAVSDADLAVILGLPPAVERQGPYDAEREGRGVIMRYGLRASEQRGLGWSGVRDPLGLGTQSRRRPLLKISEVMPPLLISEPLKLDPDPGGLDWQFGRDLLDVDLDTPAFTLEEGMWREVVTYQTPFEDVVFQDYAGDDGWSVRFGEGAFGRPPEKGTIFEVKYFTAPGTAANLAMDSVKHLDPPPGAPPGNLLSYASAATNPLPIDSGLDEEAPESILIKAPEAFRARPLRAVRPEDYNEIITRLEWVQRANATPRWTGSWMSDFVAADPLDGFALLEEQKSMLAAVIDCIRLVTRDVRPDNPDYLDIDLFVKVCVSDNAYPGQVAPRIIKALEPAGYFDPDNFTFGQPLRRSALEAVIQSVSGVKGVDEIKLRVRRRVDWKDFSEAELPVASQQIIRLQNDPLYPGRGSLSVEAHGGAG